MKKALNIIKNVIVWAIVAVAVFMMVFTIVSVTTFNRNDRSLFGFKAYTVLSDSMATTDFDAGSIVFVKEVAPSTLKEGDIISYVSQGEENFGEVITHKIRRKTVDAEGNEGFITYGTTTETDDDIIVTYPYITGKYVGHIAGVGRFFQFLKTPQGYIMCIFVPFALLILYQGIRCIRLFRQYKKEQMQLVQEEKDKLIAEREENAKMLEELRALKAQMVSAQGSEVSPEPTAPSKTEAESQEEQTPIA